jgi:cysteine desulfurase/selenocysteine lyase
MAIASAEQKLDVTSVRADFPLIAGADGRLSYLDNAATSQKPVAVTEALDRFYRSGNANIHRGVYALSQEATEAFEGARGKVARWLGAADPREIVFTRGATEAVNLVAHGLGATRLQRGDRVLLTAMEHHANIVPWQLLRERIGIEILVADVDDNGVLDGEDYERKLQLGPKLVGMVHVSNATGIINPVEWMIARAHAAGALVLLDASQSLAHGGVDVSKLDCDWLVASGHKVFGPTGIGVLYGKYQLMEALPPYQGGGDMIETVSFERTTFKAPPARFEAGTPHISGALGLAAALDYLDTLPQAALTAHEEELLARGRAVLAAIPGVRIIGDSDAKVPILSFTMESVHPHDIASVLDASGVAIRAGHHCAMPLMQRLGLSGTARASFAFYNSLADVDALERGLQRVVKLFG